MISCISNTPRRKRSFQSHFQRIYRNICSFFVSVWGLLNGEKIHMSRGGYVWEKNVITFVSAHLSYVENKTAYHCSVKTKLLHVLWSVHRDVSSGLRSYPQTLFPLIQNSEHFFFFWGGGVITANILIVHRQTCVIWFLRLTPSGLSRVSVVTSIQLLQSLGG